MKTTQQPLDFPLLPSLVFVLMIGGFCFLIQYATYVHVTQKNTFGRYTKVETNQDATNNRLPNLPGIPPWFTWLSEPGQQPSIAVFRNDEDIIP